MWFLWNLVPICLYARVCVYVRVREGRKEEKGSKRASRAFYADTSFETSFSDYMRNERQPRFTAKRAEGYGGGGGGDMKGSFLGVVVVRWGGGGGVGRGGEG